MAALCSVTSSKRILQSYRRRRHDDRPFARSQKVILPIRGFKGNRVLYGDSLDAACELTDEEEDDDDEEEEEREGEEGERRKKREKKRKENCGMGPPLIGAPFTFLYYITYYYCKLSCSYTLYKKRFPSG